MDKKKTVLIADDDAGFRFPLVNLFEDFGFKTLQAVSKEEVLKHAGKADIWIIDVRLPTSKNEGILAVQELASKGNRPPYSVIFISVNPKSLVRTELDALAKVSVDDYMYIEKPFELELLLRIVNALLEETKL